MPKYKFSDIAYNITDKKMPEPGDEELYIGLEHLDSGSLRVTRWGSEVELVGQKLVMQKGDILFGRRNTYLRRAAIAPHDGIFSAHGMIFRPKTEVIDPDYFPFFISSDYFMDAAIRISVGSLSPTVNWKTLKELEFYLPDLNQQRHTAELLSAANETKEAYQNLLSQTDELVKSQFIEMSTLWEQEYSWEPLSHYMDRITYGFTNPMPDTQEGPWKVTAKDIIDGKIDFSSARKTSQAEFDKLTAKSRPKINDILLTKDGTLGRVAIVDCDNICINQSVASICCNDKIIPQFLVSLLQMPPYQEKLLADAGGTTVRHLYITKVDKMLICVPAKAEQKRWIEFVKQTDKSKFELKQAITNISELMKSLIQQDFTN